MYYIESSMYNEHYTDTLNNILKNLGYEVCHSKAYVHITRDCIDHQSVVIDNWKAEYNVNIAPKYLNTELIIEEQCEKDYEIFYENYTCNGTNLYINMTQLKENLRLGRYINWVKIIDTIDKIDVHYEDDKIILRFYNEHNRLLDKASFCGTKQQAEQLSNQLKNGIKSEFYGDDIDAN